MLTTSPLARRTKDYWSYSRLGHRLDRRWGKVDSHVLAALGCIVEARPSERLACAAGGTLASLGHGYLIDGYGASA